MHPQQRLAQPIDLPFLQKMLFEAVFWSFADADKPTLAEALAMSDVQRALVNWGERDGDTGLIATVDGIDIGAVFYRYYTPDNHIRGYLNPNTPVLVIGVHRDYRRLGIGHVLMTGIIDHAEQQGIPQISLMVSKKNHALYLYQQQGFVAHTDTGDSLLMIRKI